MTRVQDANLKAVAFDPIKLAVTGAAVAITQGTRPAGSPSLSPDSQWVAFHSLGAAREDIWLTRADGSGTQTNLTDDAPLDRSPRWSPDGQRIVGNAASLQGHEVRAKDGLFLYSFETDRYEKITDFGIRPEWLAEIDAAARPLFLAARPGDWLGPVKLLAGFPLFSIADKRLPAAADPQIHARAEQAVLCAWTEQAINERVA